MQLEEKRNVPCISFLRRACAAAALLHKGVERPSDL